MIVDLVIDTDKSRSVVTAILLSTISVSIALVATLSVYLIVEIKVVYKKKAAFELTTKLKIIQYANVALLLIVLFSLSGITFLMGIIFIRPMRESLYLFMTINYGMSSIFQIFNMLFLRKAKLPGLGNTVGSATKISIYGAGAGNRRSTNLLRQSMVAGLQPSFDANTFSKDGPVNPKSKPSTDDAGPSTSILRKSAAPPTTDRGDDISTDKEKEREGVVLVQNPLGQSRPAASTSPPTSGAGGGGGGGFWDSIWGANPILRRVSLHHKVSTEGGT
jgi:hypothetical protein